ncbi:UNVERIFIED_CONTAM: hypothetical protein FKN15_026502 [Acipenser sinensis]
MAASRSTRVTRSSVGINGLDENFCGRTLRNRSIAHPEDTSPIPPQRARSPKKKQDCLQPLPKVTNSGKVSDLKQQQNVRESWMSPRKRGLSCSEKDFPDKQATENCERRHSEGVSPVFKRVNRCSRSGELTSSEEVSPVKLEKSTCSKGSAAENDEDCLGPKRARRCLVLDDCDKGEIKKVDSPVDRFDCPVFSGEAHQVTNGLDEQDLDDVNCSDKTVDSCVSADPTGTGSLSAGNKTLALLNGSKVDIGLPCPQRVVQLPEIAWDQYTSGLGDFEREFRNKKRHTRRLQLIFDKVGLPVRPRSPLDSKKDGGESSSYSALPSSDAPEHAASSSRSQVIRGRICDHSKPETFNQLWTVEEQKKLEQLLLKFPPEEVESKRWQKIADELGNRTAKQVASRVQKYFIKLTKAGIPVPGRTPNLYMYNKKASSKRQHHLNKHLYRPSTFMTSYEPPVYMDDDDDRSSYCSNLQDLATEDSDEESIPIEYRHLPEYKELLQLKKMKKLKLQQIHAESALVQHLGFKCDNCGVEPIQGVRWHCQDCPQDNSVDFCDGCSDCLHKTETHKPDHQLDPIYRADTFLDRDYCMAQNTGYSYLDPNYFPANR